MKLHTISKSQILPIDLNKAWGFFSDPKNLQRITPPEMNFRIRSELPSEIYPGLIIHYRLNALPAVPVSWITEITHVQQKRMFVDEQRFGPYKFWHHQHHFRTVPDGVETEDIVHYALPFDPLSRIVHALLVGPRLRTIFEYRQQILSDLF